MNRNEFLKILGFSGGILAFGANSKAITSLERICEESRNPFNNEYIDPNEWFKDNKEWLFRWFDNPVGFHDPEARCEYGLMEIFKKIYTRTYTCTLGKWNHSIAVEEMKERILKSAVFGIQMKRDVEYSNTYNFDQEYINGWPEGSGIYLHGHYPKVRTMSGFIQQTGRYPTPKDKCRFVYLAGNSMNRWFQYYNALDTDSLVYLTECRLEIL